jgi:putative endonuclease
MSSQKKILGRWGEDIAVQFLERKGYTVLTRNFFTRYGELDIVAEIEGSLIFVEVKTRSSNNFAYPEESVTTRKQQRMLHAAEQFFAQNPASPTSWQFDIIAVTRCPGLSPEIEHFENVIA